MGFFGYSCKFCGEKDQFDWFPYVVFLYEDKYYIGIYSGYGFVDFQDKEIYSKEFEEYFDTWENVEHITNELVCLHCVFKNKDENINIETIENFNTFIAQYIKYIDTDKEEKKNDEEKEEVKIINPEEYIVKNGKRGIYYCSWCEKDFSAQQSFKKHCKTKKHLKFLTKK